MWAVAPVCLLSANLAAFPAENGALNAAAQWAFFAFRKQLLAVSLAFSSGPTSQHDNNNIKTFGLITLLLIFTVTYFHFSLSCAKINKAQLLYVA